MTTEDLKKKAVKGAGINVIVSSASFVFQTIGVIVLARILQPSDFGLVVMVGAIGLLFMNFGINGFTEYIIQKENIDWDEINSIFWVHLFIDIFLAISFIFAGNIFVVFYSEPLLKGIATAMAPMFILMALTTTHIALLKRDMKFSAIAYLQLISVILSVVFALIAGYLGFQYWAVVVRLFTIPLITALGVWFICSWRPGVPKRLSLALPGLKYAIQVYGNFTLGYLTKNIDRVLLGKFQATAELGNYDRAYQLSMMPLNQLLTPLHSVALSTLSRLKKDKESFAAFYAKSVTVIAYLGSVIALMLTLSGADLILILLGKEWAVAGKIVTAFGPGTAAMLVYGTHSWLHLSLGTPNRWFRWNVVATLVTVVVYFVAARFGAVALAIAYSIRAYVFVVPGLWYAGQPLQLRFFPVFRMISVYFVSAALAYGLMAVIINNYQSLHDIVVSSGPYLRIIIKSIIGTVLYVGIVILIQRDFSSLREISNMFSIFFSRSSK